MYVKISKIYCHKRNQVNVEALADHSLVEENLVSKIDMFE